MSTPMWDIPEHCSMPVNEQGQGPVNPEEAVGVVCWCGAEGCTAYEDGPSRAVEPRTGAVGHSDPSEATRGAQSAGE